MSMGHNVLTKIVNAVRQGLDLTGLTAALDTGTKGIAADVIAESTSATGVTIDGVVLQDGAIMAAGDTVVGDNASMGYTVAEGLILTGQGTTNDITLKNDADSNVLTVATGQTAIARIGGDQTLMIVVADADYTVLAANSGKIHHVANVSADRTFTLPTAAAGLYYEFWSTMEAADSHDWLIVTGSDTNYYKGGVLWCKSDVAEATASEVTIVAPNGSDDATIQIDLPSVGTVIRMYCDGTNWFLTGFVMSVATPSYT